MSRDSVDDIQRSGVVDGGRSAQLDVHIASTGTAIGRDIHSSHTSLQGSQDIARGYVCHILHVYDGYGPCQAGLLLSHITGDYHFLQLLGILCHLNIQHGLSRRIHELRRIPDISHIQDSILGNAQTEIAIQIGHRPIGRPALLHRGTDDGNALFIFYHTFDGFLFASLPGGCTPLEYHD